MRFARRGLDHCSKVGIALTKCLLLFLSLVRVGGRGFRAFLWRCEMAVLLCLWHGRLLLYHHFLLVGGWLFLFPSNSSLFGILGFWRSVRCPCTAFSESLEREILLSVWVTWPRIESGGQLLRLLHRRCGIPDRLLHCGHLLRCKALVVALLFAGLPRLVFSDVLGRSDLGRTANNHCCFRLEILLLLVVFLMRPDRSPIVSNIDWPLLFLTTLLVLVRTLMGFISLLLLIILLLALLISDALFHYSFSTLGLLLFHSNALTPSVASLSVSLDLFCECDSLDRFSVLLAVFSPVALPGTSYLLILRTIAPLVAALFFFRDFLLVSSLSAVLILLVLLLVSV